MRVREYTAALWADWLVLMSGIASVILAFWIAYFPPPNVQAGRVLLWMPAVICFVFSSYRIWAKERDAREREIAQINTEHEEKVSILQTKLEALSAKKPNFVYSSYIRDVFHIDKDVMRSGGDGMRTMIAIIAEFENKANPPQKVSSVESVIAHITYYETDDRFYKRINKGMWLREEYNHVTFAVGDTRRLVIAASFERSNRFDNYQNDNDSPDHRHGLSVIVLESEQYIAHVELISREHTETKSDFRFRLTLKPTPFLELIEP